MHLYSTDNQTKLDFSQTGHRNKSARPASSIGRREPNNYSLSGTVVLRKTQDLKIGCQIQIQYV